VHWHCVDGRPAQSMTKLAGKSRLAPFQRFQANRSMVEFILHFRRSQRPCSTTAVAAAGDRNRVGMELQIAWGPTPTRGRAVLRSIPGCGSRSQLCYSDRIVRPSIMPGIPTWRCADVLGQTDLDGGWPAAGPTWTPQTVSRGDVKRVDETRLRINDEVIFLFLLIPQSKCIILISSILKEKCAMSEKTGRSTDQQPDEWQQDLNPDPMAGRNYGLEGRRKIPRTLLRSRTFTAYSKTTQTPSAAKSLGTGRSTLILGPERKFTAMGIWKPDLTIGMPKTGNRLVQNPERLGDADES